jgi:hypothetical protein
VGNKSVKYMFLILFYYSISHPSFLLLTHLAIECIFLQLSSINKQNSRKDDIDCKYSVVLYLYSVLDVSVCIISLFSYITFGFVRFVLFQSLLFPTNQDTYHIIFTSENDEGHYVTWDY